MADQSDAAAWAALVVAAVAMIIAIGQVSQQYVSSGQLIRLCDSVVYGGKGGLPGRGRRVWSWSQFRYRVLYEVPMFRLPRGRGNLWDIAPLSSIRFTEQIDTAANDKYWAALDPETKVGEAAWVSFCRKIKGTCHDRVVISLKHDDADRVPPELPNIPVPVSLRDIVIMALTIGMDCLEACFTRRSLAMQGDSGVITSSNHPILGLVVHFAPQIQSFHHPQPKHWRHWVARALGGIPVAGDVLDWNGKHGLHFYETTDALLGRVLLHLESGQGDGFDETQLQDAMKWKSENVNWVPAPTRKGSGDDVQVGQEHKPHDGAYKVASQHEARDNLWKQRWQHVRRGSLATSSLGRHDSGLGALEPVVMSSGQCSNVKFYWISQMNMFEGHFASPWRDEIEDAICAKAFGICLRMLIFNDNVGPKLIKFPGTSITRFYNGDLPFFSHPPYAVNVASRSYAMRKDPIIETEKQLLLRPGWHYYASFDCVLPEIAILGDKYFTLDNFDRHAQFNSVVDNHLFVTEIMRFDQWLHRASETEAILRGKSQLLKTAPALIHFIIEMFYDRFKYTYVTGHSGRECSEEIRAKLDALGLTDAEVIFLTVALLRTLRCAFCLGSGLNTRPALQILWHDLAAHMV